MESIFIEMAKHSFVVAVMILIFVGFVLALFQISKMYLSKIKNDSIANVQCMKSEIDKDVLRIENQLKSQTHDIESKLQAQNSEMTGVKDRLHALSNSVNSNNVRSQEISHKIDLMLVKLGSDPVKMAQDK